MSRSVLECGCPPSTWPLPLISTTWSVNQYSGFGGLTSLTGVQYDVTTALYYRGQLVRLSGTGDFNAQVRSDFNFDLPGTTSDVTTLDPLLTIPLTGAGPFSVPLTQSAPNSASRLATDLPSYVGNGVVSVAVLGSLLDTASGGLYNNTSDIGLSSPFVFVDNAKVFPVFGLQEFSLVATMTVTYTVPEPTTYAAGGFLILLAGHCWVARRRQRA